MWHPPLALASPSSLPTSPPQVSATQSNFLSKQLRDTALANVQGVGPATLAKLKSANIETATQLMGHFLLTGSDPVVTTRWLKDVCKVHEVEAAKVVEARPSGSLCFSKVDWDSLFRAYQ